MLQSPAVANPPGDFIPQLARHAFHDRVLALRLGAFAAGRLLAGASGEMAGVDGTRLVATPLAQVLSTERKVDSEKLLLAEVMAQ